MVPDTIPRVGVPSTKRFTIRRRIGEGGMGVVYEAFDQERGATVALKALNRFDGDALARFKREFRALQGLAHTNLVALDELFFENDEWFFTMELLDGVDFVTHVTGGASRVPFDSTVRESLGKLAPSDAASSGGGEESDVPPPFDERKLREAIRQLLEGLSALHAVDKVHRDIKPSNVLVTREGRVVLLDFGLVTEASSDDRSTGSAVLGTPAYMAPEQAASREIGPAADLYAVGAMLYETLTGRLPIEGGPLQMLLDKQTREPAPPSSIAAGVPEDLSALCVKLLRFEPAQRPTASDVLRSLFVPGASGVTLPRGSSETPIFVGRSRELEGLRAAFEATTQGKLATVLVCGESGIGKSYLVRRFTGLLLADHPETMLLEGRCYERETVPYKTLDGIVDALSRRLSRMSASEVAALLPTRCATLAQVFPVMLRVPQVAKEHAAVTLSAEPHELRQRAFVALRELFTRVAVRRPTVVVIDDLQWADDDGLRALAEILRSPDAPPLLLLGTVRLASREDAGFRRVRAVIPGEARVIDLAGLGHDDARALAVAFLKRSDAGDADPEIIASEAGGHPLFVEELARHVALGGSARDEGVPTTRARVLLDDAIWSRIQQLERPTREMAELVAIAGKPIPQEVAAAAARIEPAEFNRRAATLRASNLVRTGGARWADAIEPYHDRVREAVLAQLTPERKRALHEALAIAFEASSHPDAETLATHWRAAGSSARAARYAVAAGDQASKMFAFDHAALWYEQAVGLLPEGDADRRAQRIKLGNALAFAGRGALAAPHFEAAAAESRPIEALELRRRAADQLLRGGRTDEGFEATRAVLASIGIRFPKTRFETILAILFYRFVLAVRGLAFQRRELGQITAEELARVDTCMMVGYALSLADPLVGTVFQTRALLFALDAGEIERVVHAVALELPFVAIAGGRSWRRTARLFDHARALAVESGSVESRAYVALGIGVSLFSNGRYEDCLASLQSTLDLLRDGATGLVHEQLIARSFAIIALANLGRFRELCRLQDESLREGLARGDVYVTISMKTGFANLAWLVADRPDVAESEVRDAMAGWSAGGFHTEHYHALLARVHLLLYREEAVAADAVAKELLRRTKGSSLWRIQAIRLYARHVNTATASLLLQKGLGDSDALLRRVALGARAIEREQMAWALPFVTLARAQLARWRGARDEAIRGLDDAARGFDAADMAAYAAATRDRVARLRGDASTAAEIERAAAFFRGEGVAAPARFIAMLVPGLPA